jgi:hypothetical protein
MRSVLALVLAGCYSPQLAPCAVHCGHDSECPADLSCGDDHFCHASDDNLTCARLSVTTSGTGGGHITSSPEGIDCASGQGPSCDAAFPNGTMITLSESPFDSDHFGHWSGDACDGSNDATCMLQLMNPMSVDASFF